MINMPAILIANGSAVLLLVILLISSRRTLHAGLFDHKLFTLMILCSIFQSVFETIGFVVDGRPGLRALNIALNSLVYVDNIFFAFLWVIYADYELFADTNRLKRVYRFVAIPALAVIAGVAVNLFFPIFFEISADNLYFRGTLFMFPFIVSYLYLSYGVAIIYMYRNKVRRYLFMPAVIFMIPIILGSVLQFIFYGYSLIWLGTAIALTSLYINVQNKVSFIDSMTGLFARQYLTRYLSAQEKNRAATVGMTGIMLDIDHFKSINDTYGHLVGDEAITKAGRIILDSVPSKAVATRYAGDEFVIIIPNFCNTTAEDIRSRIDSAAAKLNKSGKNSYELRFSAGFSVFEPDDTMDTFLSRMDAAMYADKRRNGHVR